MSRPAPLPGWRAALLYTAFDLRNLLSQRSAVLMMFLLPLTPMLGVLIVAPMALVGSVAATDTRVVVVAPDVTLHAAVELGLQDEDRVVEVSAAPPADLEARLAAGEVDVVATLADDFRATAEVDARPGAGTLSPDVEGIEEELRKVWVRERVRELGAVDAPMVVVDEDGTPLPAASEADEALAPTTAEDAADAGRTAQRGLGLFIIGLFGTMVGLGVGPALAKSMKVGFNHLLSLGTSARAIYVSELASVATVQVAQSSTWWLLLCLAYVGLGKTLPVPLPPLLDVIASAPLFVGLAMVAGMQAVALSLFAARAGEDLPQEVREKGVGFVMLPLFFLGAQVLDLESGKVLATLSALPITGPLTVWMQFVGGEVSVLPYVLLQVAYAAGALVLGAWVFALDESPQAHLKRAWRRRRAA